MSKDSECKNCSRQQVELFYITLMAQGMKMTTGPGKRKPFTLKPRQFARPRRPTDGMPREETPRRTFPRIFKNLSPVIRLAALKKSPKAEEPGEAAGVPRRRRPTLIDIMKLRRRLMEAPVL